jgi:hypothetical protein
MHRVAVAAALASPALVMAACSPHASTVVDADAGGDAEVVLLPFPDAGQLVWTGWVGDFVHDYCVQCHNPAAPCSGSGCHPSAGPLPDFRLHDAVVSFAPQIRCGIAVDQDPAWSCGTITPKQFPVEMGGNPLPTDAQRALIVEWIDAGTL